MRISLVLICSFALAVVAGAQNIEEKSPPKKKPTPSGPVSHNTGGPHNLPANTNRSRTGTPGNMGGPHNLPANTNRSRTGTPGNMGGPHNLPANTNRSRTGPAGNTGIGGNLPANTNRTRTGTPGNMGDAHNSPANTNHSRPGTAGNTGIGGNLQKDKGVAGNTGVAGNLQGHTTIAKGEPHGPVQHFPTQHFHLPTQARPTNVTGVDFHHGMRIERSELWAGPHYHVFRDYRPEWHDSGWWNHHHSRVVFVYGGWYYWNEGYWYPAWGYAPKAYYAYDGPIYAPHNLSPDQVVANVQAALQQQGYYQGDVDGVLGPVTREAIANYQRDQGLEPTSAIDQPTLESLGIA
jgi:hypothetical protein